jgi:two-component system sensor histidine kinase DevS
MTAQLQASPAPPPPPIEDPEYRTLLKLATLTSAGIPDHPVDALQQVVDLARELTESRYAALAVTDENDNIEGFVVAGLDAEEERKLKAAPLGHGPLGTMRQDGLAVRIDDLDGFRKSFGFPPKHPDMKTLLGVPLWVDTTLRGAVYVTDREDGEAFVDGDEAILRLLARHAGAIIKTRWY